MNKYIVYFEIFGKKMKTAVMAENQSEAKTIIKNKIKFHKIEIEDGGEDFIDNFFSLFNKKTP
jgi:predicted PolB exonuclease-like 3'-5' exonuclease